ncbi:MAG: Sulfotransferase [candidate division WS6 bacterium 34_10]|uniref:Sulfotransferase n=1 Tax=candidate division WS6 bacterium 34_10 TaxID=1641389 RepID=A0A101HJ55_9BACT|nr:MAG: Sulfotransferase [candidate division WS6 bacterium 34_10]
MKKVDFFIIGNPKSGTTTYYNLLKLHPEVFLPRYKELRYFCTDLHRESDQYHGAKIHYPVRTIEQYQGFYKDAKAHQFLGEVTPHYAFSKEAAKNIYEYNPDAKIILFLREPASFIESLHRELSGHLSENQKDLFIALDLEEQRRKGEALPEKVPTPRYLFYSEWTNFYKQIQRYVELFGAKQIKVIFLKQIATDEKKVLKDILKFIGTKNTDFYPEGEIFRNKSKTLRFKSLWKFLKNPSVLKFIRKVVPLKLFSVLDRLVFKIFLTPAKEGQIKKLDDNERHLLKKRYKKNVVDLNRYLNKENLIDFNLVKFWGYEDI